MAAANSQSSLAKFAFNIYGSLNHQTPPLSSVEGSTSPASSFSSTKSASIIPENFNYRSNKLVFNCEREVTTLSQLNFPLNVVNSFQSSENELAHHVIIGGRNYLKILALSEDQSRILQDINVLEQGTSIYGNSRVPTTNKLNNINTVKAQSDTIACGLSNGLITIYKVSHSGKSRLIQKFSDHKRCINSLDFLGAKTLYDTPNQLISGSQDGSIKLWDLRSSSPRAMLTIVSSSHSDPIRSCQYSPHSMVRNKITVLSVHDSGALCKFDIRSGGANGSAAQSATYSPERKWNIHTGPALSLHIHPEREYVVTGGRDQKICVFNYGDSQTSNRITPDDTINTYGPVMKVRWCMYPDSAAAQQFGEALDTYQQTNEFPKFEDKLSYDEREALYSYSSSSRTNSLKNYDLACSYLNDDSTISIYNLNRKYIPKEVITSSSNKPFQNFIWAHNNNSSRKIWTITKSNVFATYDLDFHDSVLDSEVSRPLEELTNVAMAWDNGFSDLCIANQEKYEFEITEVDSQTSDSDGVDPIEGEYGSHYRSTSNSVVIMDDNELRSFDQISPGLETEMSMSFNNNKTFAVGSLPGGSKYAPGSSATVPSPLEKPPLYRSSTHYSLHMAKSPSPIPQRRGSATFNYSESQTNLSGITMPRPKLTRNLSQTTQDSSISIGSAPQPSMSLLKQKKSFQVNHASPYLVPLSLPLPLNDDAAFEALSNNYLISIPDGFNLVDVCLLNASVAASAYRYRECQVWKVLAVSLEDQYVDLDDVTNFLDETVEQGSKEQAGVKKDEADEDQKDVKSISSDLGNFVGSYNSNSTSTTNYGGMGSTGGSVGAKASSMESIAQENPAMGSSVESETKTHPPSGNLMDMINSSRVNSFSTNISPAGSNLFLRVQPEDKTVDKNESAILDDDEVDSGQPDLQPKSSKTSLNRRRSSQLVVTDSHIDRTGQASPIAILSPSRSHFPSADHSPHSAFLHTQHSRDSRSSSFAGQRVASRFGTSYHTSEDLDNENLNILNNAATNSSPLSSMPTQFSHPSGSPNNVSHHSHQSIPHHSHYGSAGAIHGSFSSRRSSAVPSYGFQRPKFAGGNAIPEGEDDNGKSEQLNDVKEGSLLNDIADRATNKSELTKAIKEEVNEHSLKKPWMTEDLIEKALAYATNQGDIVLCATLAILFFDSYNSVISETSCLEWLSLYVEILHRKRLFVNAIHVVNCAPKVIMSQLKNLTSGEVDLRFFCCWCQKLLVNEKTKHKENNEEFGYWYCDECSRKQSNCIYCNEPCKGLTVVVSLKCGHRGHFGCLREWFVEDENVECPGGCDYNVL
ncbi:restriction of telomere capping protein 1 [Scheffersomyces xylosifermentans]|uniref:restriction of telomere capping protein 1 n=1 Tax=Scheffersomyces xylosifermentans TaxID=1304137 RepID=UPI00315CCB20